MKTYYFFPLILLLIFSSCKGSDKGKGFGFLDTSDEVKGNVEILSFTPEESPAVIINSESTFGVTLKPGAGGDISYTWYLDGSIVQAGASAFYNVDGSLVSAGEHNIKVIAKNDVSSDSKLFILHKNSPPELVSTNPGQIGNSVNCGSPIILEVEANDVDGDALTFSWNLDNLPAPSIISVSTVGDLSEAEVTPGCDLVGSHDINAIISDGKESTKVTFSLLVANPAVATILTFLPAQNPFRLVSTGTQIFSITASGKAPLTYLWKLNGVTIPAQTNPYYEVNAVGLSAGDHTLEVIVRDSDSEDSHVFNIVRNAKPTLASLVPATQSFKIPVGQVQPFSLNFNDVNNDPITVRWEINSSVAPNSYLSNPVTGSNSSSVSLTASSATKGNNVIKVTVSDAFETGNSYEWDVNVNLLSDACNNLQAGRICTIAGMPGIGSNISPASENNKVRITPYQIIKDDLDNLIFSDRTLNVIWYYNRSASNVTKFGQTINAGKLKSILGTPGAAGAGLSGTDYTNFALNSPSQLAFHAGRQHLFIADYANHRVLRLDENGIVDRVAGGGANNTAGNTNALAIGHYFGNTLGLSLDEAGNKLYVSSYYFAIKSIDITSSNFTTWTASHVAGRLVSGVATQDPNANNNVGDGALGGAGGYLSIVRAIYYYQNMIFIADNCRIRVANLSGSSVNFFTGANQVTVAGNSLKTIIGVNQCATAYGLPTVARLNSPVDIAPYIVSGSLKGLLVADGVHQVLLANFTNDPITIGTRLVATGEVQAILGTGTAGYNGNTQVGNLTMLSTPTGLAISGNSVIVADQGNNRVRSLQLISSSTSNISNIMGGRSKIGFSEGTNFLAHEAVFNTPQNLAFNPANKRIYISDGANGRIRSIDTLTGDVNTEMGSGFGYGVSDQTAPSATLMREPRQVSFYDDFTIYTDSIISAAANRSCFIRGFNSGSAATDLFGTAIDSNRIATVAGNYTDGCVAWSPTDDGENAKAAALHIPFSHVVSNHELIISNTYSHCLLKVGTNGVVNRFSGLCGTAANATGNIGAAGIRYNYPTTLILDPEYESAGNFFMIDSGIAGTASSYVKYVNRSSSTVTIFSTDIPAGQVATIMTVDTYANDLAVFEEQICYSSGQLGVYTVGGHSVICKDRTDPFEAVTLRAGRSSAVTVKGGIQHDAEQEGIPAQNASLATPAGIAFDDQGNLYIAEKNSHVIRMVKKWW